MNDNGGFCVALLCAVAALALALKRRQGKIRRQFPPGPRGLPLLGNVLDIPRDVPIWQGFKSIAQKFNTDVFYLKVLTTDFVVLNSSEVVSDLCERRSSIYSDRPLIPMLELIGQYSWTVPLMRYGSLWRNSRRLCHEFLNVRAVAKFDEYQRKHAYRLLLRLLESPTDFFDQVKFAIGALVMEVTYGMNVTTKEDRHLRAVAEAVELTSRVVVPGAFLVDVIPILKHVPEWFPGAGFKAFARVAREKFEMSIDGPLEYVKESMKSTKSDNTSIAGTCFDRARESSSHSYDENIIRGATGSMYIAAVETTVSLLQTFFLAMALNPHVKKRAQEELDSVLRGERLPDFSDEENLPYISAIVKELFRWECPFPMGIPKQVMEDDIYNGYFIPAGTTIVENMWAMFYDESIYPTPHEYDPERYLKDGKLDRSAKDPENNVFGSGRRICPGRYFAMRTLFLNIACILTLFEIEAPVDEKLEAKFSEESAFRSPTRFKCTIRPRPEAIMKLLGFARAGASL